MSSPGATTTQPPSYTATVVAGNGTQGGGGDGGPATSAQLSYPAGIAVDAGGSLYIAGWHNHRVRVVAPNGVITTVAGTGVGGSDGDGGPATSARLSYPVDVAVDGAGSLYVIDLDSHRVRKVSNGVITTVAGTGTAGFDGDGGPATAARLFGPRSIAVDGAGNLYIADTGNYRVRKVAADGVITTVAGSGTSGGGGDNGPATAAQLSHAIQLAVDGAGTLYISDSVHHRVRKVAANGVITTVAGTGTAGFDGDGGPATSARLNCPVGVEVDGAGNLYIADSRNDRIRRVSPSGVITTVADNVTSCFNRANDRTFDTPRFFDAMAMDNAGDLYLAGRDRQQVVRITLAEDPALPASGTVVSWINRRSSLRLGVRNESSAEDAQIHQSPGGLKAHRRWRLTVVAQDRGVDYYTIENMKSGKVVEAVGTSVVQRTYAGARHQQWQLLPVTSATTGAPVYRIANRDSGRFLHVDSRSSASIEQRGPQPGYDGQEWELEPA
ncbi:RICIN domain-containing protein [Actinosynnema sp. NPDC059335]|uniref:NHL domain-containing protein n=1 Tax=Actinosynnema sp. NPDC059335 TaxID=3346804 RepID=UPI0036735B4D